LNPESRYQKQANYQRIDINRVTLTTQRRISMPLNTPILDETLNSISLEKIKAEMGPPPWGRPVVVADHIRGTVICQNSGQINDRHCHDYDEWWVILEGEIDWVIEGREDRPVKAKAGDFVFAPAQTFHQIYPTGGKPSIRLAISLPGSGHLHERPARRAKITIE
jgi:mannose-6-phosphate isomerase-like protein (cupin superfamily)